jgi:AhpD family alkylhydroperoxidase
MSKRITDRTNIQGAYSQLAGIERYLHQSGLDERLILLMKMRVSQINGCAYCLALHARHLRELGEREDRIHLLSAWWETDWYTDRERAALAWGEAVTRLEHQHVPDEIYAQARAQFSEKELADLTLAVIAINGWNRANIALMQTPPDHFEISEREEAAAD